MDLEEISQNHPRLKRGIEHENKRLAGCSFITVETRYEVDIDGLMESVQLHDGFADEVLAIAYLKELSDKTLASHHSTWIEDDAYYTESENKITRWSRIAATQDYGYGGYNRFSFYVKKVKGPEIIGPKFYSMFPGKERELFNYLCGQGPG